MSESNADYQRRTIIRAALAAIERGQPIEDALADALDTMNEWARLDVLTSMDPQAYGVGELLTAEDIARQTFPVASRRQLPPRPEPQGKSPESGWWGP